MCPWHRLWLLSGNRLSLANVGKWVLWVLNFTHCSPLWPCANLVDVFFKGYEGLSHHECRKPMPLNSTEPEHLHRIINIAPRQCSLHQRNYVDQRRKQRTLVEILGIFWFCSCFGAWISVYPRVFFALKAIHRLLRCAQLIPDYVSLGECGVALATAIIYPQKWSAWLVEARLGEVWAPCTAFPVEAKKCLSWSELFFMLKAIERICTIGFQCHFSDRWSSFN